MQVEGHQGLPTGVHLVKRSMTGWGNPRLEFGGGMRLPRKEIRRGIRLPRLLAATAASLYFAVTYITLAKEKSDEVERPVDGF